MSEPVDDPLEPPAHLGRPRFEEQRAVSERSVGSTGLLAVLALAAALVSFVAGETAFGWIALALFAIACPGFALLVRRLVYQQRVEEGGWRPRVLP
jgi:hypothetical protein